MTDFVALLLFETMVAGHHNSYTEEIHLLQAPALAEAEALALARATAQEITYANSAGEAVSYRFLRIIDLQPYLFGDPAQAIYTRSLTELEVAKRR